MLIMTDSSVKRLLLEDVSEGAVFMSEQGKNCVKISNWSTHCMVIAFNGHSFALPNTTTVSLASKITIKY